MSLALKTSGALHGTEGRWHYVPDLGRSDYGDPGELIARVNAACVMRELSALGVDAYLSPERTWLCNVVALVVDAYHPATLPYLAGVADRLDAYPVLDEDALGLLEWEEGYCQGCGSFGLPDSYGRGDACMSCEYVPYE
jgi:hypothetical protein